LELNGGLHKLDLTQLEYLFLDTGIYELKMHSSALTPLNLIWLLGRRMDDQDVIGGRALPLGCNSNNFEKNGERWSNQI
jgi:hypothetical protein